MDEHEVDFLQTLSDALKARGRAYDEHGQDSAQWNAADKVVSDARESWKNCTDATQIGAGI